MINGQKHKDIILNILSDGRPHYSREFVNAGLLEYRRRMSDLREEGYVIQSIKLGKRPAYILHLKAPTSTDNPGTVQSDTQTIYSQESLPNRKSGSPATDLFGFDERMAA